MFPAWVPVVFDVVTVTLVPAASAVVIAPTLSVELSAVGVQTMGEPLQLTLDVVVVMSTLESGSSSHCPAVPFGAAALTEAVRPTTSVRRPEVSTNPPWPPWLPPCALILPLKTVVPSDQTAT